jgi:hypothetical protein
LQVCGAITELETSQGTVYLKSRPLQPNDQWYFYGVYYCGISGYKLGQASWDVLRPDLFGPLLQTQQPDGSWRGANNERSFGAIYPTAMSVLSLTVEYGYLPIYQR